MKMQILYLALVFTFISASFQPAKADNTLVSKQVFVLNAPGTQNDSTTLGVYNIRTGTYESITTIPDDGALKVVLNDDHIYVAGDTMLAMYDIETFELLHVRGGMHDINDLAVHSNYIIASLNDQLEVYDPNDLSHVHTFPGVSDPVSSLTVAGDTLYVAFPVDADILDSELGIFDMANLQEADRLELGSVPDQLNYLHNDGQYVYGLARRRNDPGNETVMRYEIATRDTSYMSVSAQTPGQIVFEGGWGVTGDYFLVTYNGNLAAIDVSNFTMFQTQIHTDDFNYAVIDTLHPPHDEEIYVGTYLNNGQMHRMDFFGSNIQTFNAGPIPSALAVHYAEVPTWGYLIPYNGFTGTFREGTAAEPDYVCTNEEAVYEVIPPAGMTNDDYIQDWGISIAEMETADGTPATNFTLTHPDNGDPGTIHFDPVEAEAGESFIIEMTIQNYQNATSGTYTHHVTVNPRPDASFTYDDDEVTVEFTDQSSIPVGSSVVNDWHWDFGDGNNAQQQNPEHTYDTADTYTVSLIAESDRGCVSEPYIQIITLEYDDEDPDTTAPFGNIVEGNGFTGEFRDGDSQNPDYLCADQVAEYIVTPPEAMDNDDYDTDWEITDYTLEAADETQAANFTFNAPAGGQSATFTYVPDANEAAKTFELTFTYYNYNADTSTVMNRFIEVHPLPVADFSYVSDELTVAFSDESSVPVGQTTIDNRQWNFGDGNTATDENPEHTYDTAGTYTVTLLAESNIGCVSETVSQDVTVDDDDVMNFIAIRKDEAMNVDVYPNPFRDKLTLILDLKQSGDVRLTIFDLTGREMASKTYKEKSAGEHELMLSGEEAGLTAGVYFLQIEAGNSSSTHMIRFKQ